MGSRRQTTTTNNRVDDFPTFKRKSDSSLGTLQPLTINGRTLEPKQGVTREEWGAFVRNTESLLDGFARRRIGGSNTLDPVNRDLNKECGYPVGNPSVQQYRDMYDRSGIARRVVQVHSDECFINYPSVYETEKRAVTRFDKRVRQLEKQSDLHFWANLHRADVISGIGSFGIVVLGFNDGKDLDQPVVEGTASELLYMMPYDEYAVRIVDMETGTQNPRYNQPTMYSVLASDPATNTLGTPQAVLKSRRDQFTGKDTKVHWTRCLHLADNRRYGNVFGTPRQQEVFNHLLDLRKIYGGSAEMYWKGAFPGYSVQTLKEFAGESEMDHESLRLQMEAFMNGLQRYVGLDGAEVKSLATQVADPSGHIDVHIKAICAAKEVPYRTFMGTEAGHLASTQDTQTWNNRVRHRQLMYLEPYVIDPFFQRLIYAGVLPQPRTGGWTTFWEDRSSLTPESKADVGLKTAQSLLQYVTSGSEKVMPYYHFLTSVLHYPDALANVIVDEARKQTPTGYLTESLWSSTVQKEKITAMGAKKATKSGSTTPRPSRNGQ